MEFRGTVIELRAGRPIIYLRVDLRLDDTNRIRWITQLTTCAWMLVWCWFWSMFETHDTDDMALGPMEHTPWAWVEGQNILPYHVNSMCLTMHSSWCGVKCWTWTVSFGMWQMQSIRSLIHCSRNIFTVIVRSCIPHIHAHRFRNILCLHYYVCYGHNYWTICDMVDSICISSRAGHMFYFSYLYNVIKRPHSAHHTHEQY
jgi:hypothetical protein